VCARSTRRWPPLCWPLPYWPLPEWLPDWPELPAGVLAEEAGEADALAAVPTFLRTKPPFSTACSGIRITFDALSTTMLALTFMPEPLIALVNR